MPHALSNGARLYYEEAGTGHPVIFVHEFGGDHRAWEAQMRWFSRQYRCIAYSARGYVPSDVPREAGAYGYNHAVDDIAGVLRHLGIAKAHVAGLSMGGYAALLFGVRYPAMASALVVAGAGSGAPAAARDSFRIDSEARAEHFLSAGSAAVATEMGHSPTRIQLKRKDPRGWDEFVRQLGEHDPYGSAMTMRHYQAARPSIWDFDAELKQMRVPTLLAVGDEDDPCIETNIYLKNVLPNAGLWMVPRSGHCINLEEPALFNAMVGNFFTTVEHGRWAPRSDDAKA